MPRIFFAMVALGALVGPSFAEDIVPNTISCAAFKKEANGTWSTVGSTTFDIGNVKALTLDQKGIGPRMFSFGGADLYAVLQAKCGK